MIEGLLVSLFVFVLAVLLGFEVISKVPPILHTPLMSGSRGWSWARGWPGCKPSLLPVVWER